MNWAVVMAGGRGTRFWPASRNRRPKPFLNLLGRRTLLEDTVNRLVPFIPRKRILVVLQSDLVREARRILKGIPPQNILGEPVGRNTAPCCVWAASWIEARDPEAKLIFLPADQHITPSSLYQKTLRTGFEIVDECPVLLGMKPDSPQTGFGYLEVHRKSKKIHGISYFKVMRFHEKPNLKTAKRFLKRGNFFWNGGTFIWRLGAFKRAVKKYAPRIYSGWESLRGGRRPTKQSQTNEIASATLGTLPRNDLKRVYQKFPSLSIDYAVMEKMRNVHCLLSPFQWSDVGGWEGLAQFWPKDKKGNYVGAPLVGALRTKRAGTRLPARQARPAPTIFINSEKNIVKPDCRLIALLGVQNLLVIDTPDALLIAPRARTEEIRDVVRELEREKAWKYL